MAQHHPCTHLRLGVWTLTPAGWKLAGPPLTEEHFFRYSSFRRPRRCGEANCWVSPSGVSPLRWTAILPRISDSLGSALPTIHLPLWLWGGCLHWLIPYIIRVCLLLLVNRNLDTLPRTGIPKVVSQDAFQNIFIKLNKHKKILHFNHNTPLPLPTQQNGAARIFTF